MAFYLYDDVAPIPDDEQGPLSMQYTTSAYNAVPELEEYWQPMNAAHGDTRTVQGIDTHLRNVEFVLFNPADSQKFPRTHFHQPWNLQEPYPYHDRSLRYVSPGGHWGGDKSASDLESASSSEDAWSPGSSQNLSAYPKNHCDFNMFGSPNAETPCQGGIGSFPPDGAYFDQNMRSNGAPVVAMCEIQQYPDPAPDVEEHQSHSIKIELGSELDRQPEFKPSFNDPNFQKFHDDSGLGDSATDDESMKDDGEEDEDNFSDYSPRKRPQRRAPHSVRYAAPGSPTTRRTGPKRTASGDKYRVHKPTEPPTTSGRSQIKSRKSRKSHPPRPFVCSFAAYGCPSTFGSKNEWKRHVSSQHLQLGFYRCDTGQCDPETKAKNGTHHSRGYNDFNRKDLFTQHHRRMHCPWPVSKTPSEKMKEDFENGLEEVRQRCWMENRQAPGRSVCGFCDRVFDGPASWEERMEHVGKHYEKVDGDEKEDDELRDWAIREGLIRQDGSGRWRLVSLKEDRLDRVKEELHDDDDDDDDDDDADGEPE